VEVSKYRAFVEVLIWCRNIPNQTQNTPRRIIKKEASVHISNLMLVDAKGVATRIGRQRNDKNNLVRYSKKSGRRLSND
jgi:large subunit ribosomal protein L24